MCTHVESHWWAFYSTRELTCVMSQVLACSSIWELINVQTTAGWRTDALSFLILGACLVLCFFGGKGGANCIRRRKHTGSEWSAERTHVKPLNILAWTRLLNFFTFAKPAFSMCNVLDWFGVTISTLCKREFAKLVSGGGWKGSVFTYRWE